MSSRPRLIADDRGFTMITIVVLMMILGVFSVGAWAAANGDFPGVRKDTDRKRAYEAAQAGIQWYSFQLQKDTNYWTYCADRSRVAEGVNVQGARTSWRTLPESRAQFAVELMPARGTGCTPGSGAVDTMLDQGVLRIRSTGRYGGVERQLVATFRRSAFLDYLWFTQWETQPPAAYTSSGGSPSWAQANCDKKRASRPSGCTAISFITNDGIKGPVHTEDDSLLVCGSPAFGRNLADKIEVARGSSAAGAFKAASGCSNGVTPTGTVVSPSRSLGLPDDNAALQNVADLRFSGNTCLDFQNGRVLAYPNQTRWGQPAGGGFPDYRLQLVCTGTPTAYALQPDTVIWVGNTSGGCSGAYNYYQKYNNPSSCGDVAVSGTYATNVTIGAANDIIVRGDLVHAGDALMGLVANKFVRVYHPVNPLGRDGSTDCTSNLLATPAVSRIDAAILATSGSFIADNWDCGAPLGSLTVFGAIAQYWRATVGTHVNGTATHGYLKNYLYDDRLKYREPPQFLDPVTSSWNLLRQSEQAPVRSG